MTGTEAEIADTRHKIKWHNLYQLCGGHLVIKEWQPINSIKAVAIKNEEDYKNLPYRALQALCKARGITAVGKAPVLIKRLEEHDG